MKKKQTVKKTAATKQEKKKLAYFCSHCSSDDIRHDADVRWDAETQQWDIVAVFDNCTCGGCGKECSVVEKEVE